MIYAIPTQYNQSLRLEIIRPDTTVHDFKQVKTMSEASQLMDAINRDYMIDKLTKWLRQRRAGLNAVDQKSRSAAAFKLEVLLRWYKQADIKVVARVVRRHMAEFISLAPGTQSTFYNHHKNIIEPILQYCRENGGAA